MSVRPQIGLSQKRKLTLTPAMRSALSLLRMPTDQLTDEITREAAENPFLEVRVPSFGSAFDLAMVTLSGHDSLPVSLVHQIDLQRLDGETRAAALFLVTQLREDGYLDTSLGELSQSHDLSLAGLEAGLAALHRCEPTGVGARDLAECLRLQLIEKGFAPQMAEAIVRHLEDFADDRLDRVIRALGLTHDEAGRIANDIRSLSPRPMAPESDWIIPRVPELMVDLGRDGQIAVSLNREALPVVSLTDLGTHSRDSVEMQICFDRARYLTRGLAARAVTLLRIGRHIVDTQSAFFLNNHLTIRPESRAEAAAALDMHPSTFGRALAGKALVAGGKVYALAQFFSRAVVTANGSVSTFDVQARLRGLIAAEDRHAPLADETICAQLKNEGVDIARRTVAKYRKCMRIPPSFERRRRNLSEPAGSHAKSK